MNFNKKYFTISSYVFLSAVVVILFRFCCFRFSAVLGFFSWIWKALNPIIWGIALALLLNQMYMFFREKGLKFLCRKKPHPMLRKVLALILTYVILLLVLTALVMTILPQVAERVLSFTSQSTYYLTAAQNWINSQLSSFSFLDFFIHHAPSPSSGDEAAAIVSCVDPEAFAASSLFDLNSQRITALHEQEQALLSSGIHIDIVGMVQQLLDRVLQTLTAAVPQIVSSVTAVLNELKDFALGLIISIYLLASKERLTAMTLKFLTALTGEKGCAGLRSLGKIYYGAFVSFLTGKTFDAVIVSCVCYVVFTFSAMPSPMLLSLLIGIMNIIPFLGPIIATFIGAIIVLLFAPSKLLLFLILTIIIEQADAHFIEPHIIGAHTDLSSFWILTSVILMGSAFGIVGMFIAVPTFSVLLTLLRRWTNRRLEMKAQNTPDLQG